MGAALDQIAPLDPLPTKVDHELLRVAIYDPALVGPHKQEVVKVKASVEEKIGLVEKLLIELEIMEMHFEHIVIGEHVDPKLEELVAKEIFDEDQEVEASHAELAEMLAQSEQRYIEHQTARREHLEMMEHIAKEDAEQRFKDLAELMKQSPQGSESREARDAGEQREAGDESVRPEVELPSDAPMGAESRDSREARQGGAGENGVRPLVELRPDTPGVNARSISVDGMPMEWMYVTTWYTIGPFPNELRQHLHTKFPPETVVDLDASYPGKNGKRVKWTFVQSDEPSVVPADPEQYAIYYAFTEIYSDRDRNVWIAVGSDDKANVWINDLPVWISGDQLKGWRINEGYRKVHLKKGRNRVLYRVENGWLGVCFSLSLHVKRE